MRKKDCLNILKEESNKIEIKNNTDYILNNYESYDKNDVVIINKKSHKAPILFSSLSLILVSALLIFIIIRFNMNNDNNQLTIGKEEMVLGEEILAVGNITSFNTELASNNEYTLEEYNNASIDINEYLLIGEAFINNNIEIKKELNTNSKYNYEYVMNVLYKDIKSYDLSYSLYYNQISSDDDYILNGIFVNSDSEYNMEAKIEYDKGEFELKMILYFSSNSYIEIKNEKEVDNNKYESEYQFRYVKNNNEIKKTKIEYESKTNKKQLKLQIEELDNDIECEFEYKHDVINVKYNSDNMECEATIYVYDTYYLYYFDKDNVQIRISKN